MSDIKNFERNKYFYGKLMTVRDFETEQSYFIEKQRLINRLIHGAGVVCGLMVDEVDGTKIKINPGVAIDCCGREIIVPEEKVVNLEDSLEGANKLYVLLKYNICEKESVPVINNVSACEETCCYNRILETYKIEIISKDLPDDCTPADGELCDEWPAAENPEEFVEYWIEKGCPECPQEPAVLLAAITLQNSTIIIDNAIKDDDDEGIKKSLVFSNAHLYELIKCVEKQPGSQGPPGETGPGLEEELTRIEWITPPFMLPVDGINLDIFLNRGIKISFSNPIVPETVNNDTFQVAVFAPFEKKELLMHHYEYIEGEITIHDDDKEFTFIPIKKDQLKTALYEYLTLEGDEGKLKILVQIKCDFIEDKNDKAVAGHHLLGQGNSGLNIDGNGKYNIQGGIFESWFTLKYQLG